jgi:hypothetical protein
MLILITVILLFATALALLILQVVRPQFRFAWLAAVGATFVAWMSVLLWRPLLPLSIVLHSWEPADLFRSAPMLLADQFSWLYALSLVTLALATLLTATVREGFPNPTALAVSLAVCGLGLLAVTAGNPLSLVLVWAALDLVELATMLRSVSGPLATQRVVTAFSVHAAAIILLLLAQVTSGGGSKALDFSSITPQAGILLLAAAGLRLGVLPVNLPYLSQSSLRRGVGTSVRLVSASASLVLLSRIPTASLPSLLTLLILVLSALAGLYSGWMWLRAPDELAGRPFWIIGLASLAIFAGLRGNPVGAAAWGVALILAGAAIFLSSIQQVWLNRLLFVGAWSISSLPFSLTATGWNGSAGGLDLVLPLFIAAQAFMIAGFVRHALRPSSRVPLESHPIWARSVYPAGIGLLILVQFLLGFLGWDGAFQIGVLPAAIAAALLTLGLLWAVPRLAILNPVPAHWLRPATVSRLDQFFQIIAGTYRWLAGVSRTLSETLEGEAGLMWTLLFLILFVVMIVQRNP